MPIFEVQGPDGKTYEVDAPDIDKAISAFAPAAQQDGKSVDRSVARQQGQQAVQKQMAGESDEYVDVPVYDAAGNPTMQTERIARPGGKVQYIADPFAKGAVATLPFGEDIAAAIRSRNINPMSPEFQKEKEKVLGEAEAWKEQAPGAYYSGAVAGMAPQMALPMAAAKGTTFLGKTALGALEGATYGALTGLGTGVTGEERLKSTGEGALIGGGLGAALPVVGEGLKYLGKPVSSVYRAVAERVNPEKYSEDIAKAKILEDLQRSKMTPEQAQEEFEYLKTTGASPSYFDVSPSLTSRAETIAQRPGQSGEDLTKSVIERQEGQRKRIMSQAKERFDIDKPYFDKVDDAVEALRENASPLYKEAHNAKIPPEAQVEIQPLMDDIRAAYPEAEDYAKQLYLSERRKDFKDTGMSALTRPEFEGLPGVRQYDYIMRGLGQVVEKNTNDLTGKVSPIGVGALQMKNDLAKILDESIPQFAAARAQYAGDAEVKNALLEGRKNFLRVDPEELSRDWEKMSVAEKEAYRAGAFKSIRDKLFGSADYTDATKRIGQAIQDRRDALNIIIPEKASAKLFQDFLEAEAKMAANAQRIKAGSPTARRLEGAKDLEATPDLSTIGIASDVARGKFLSSANRVFNLLVKNPSIPEARANAIGKMLKSGTSEDVDNVTKSLAAFVKEQENKKIASRIANVKRAAVATRATAGRTSNVED